MPAAWDQSFSTVVPSGGQLFHTSLLVAAGTPAQSLLATTPFHFAFSWSPLCGFHLFPCKYSCHQIQIHLTQGKLHITVLNSTHKDLSSRKATAKDSTWTYIMGETLKWKFFLLLSLCKTRSDCMVQSGSHSPGTQYRDLRIDTTNHIKEVIYAWCPESEFPTQNNS